MEMDEVTTAWVEPAAASIEMEPWDPAVKGPYVPPPPAELPPLTQV